MYISSLFFADHVATFPSMYIEFSKKTALAAEISRTKK